MKTKKSTKTVLSANIDLTQKLLPTLLLCLFYSTACKFPSPPSKGKEDDVPTKKTRKAGDIITKAPSLDPPEALKGSYDPAEDPQNTEGYDLSEERSPDDPEDRKKKPFTISALYDLKTVSSPELCPKGEKVLFTVVTHDLKTGKSNSEIYVVNYDGSNLRRMTRNEGSDASPIWGPDGKSFYFVSTRTKKAQLWKMMIDGGEPQQITSFSAGISNPVISGDGTKIAFTARVYPDLAGDEEANTKRLEQRKKSHFNAHVADNLLFRHWSFYKDDRRSHTFVYDLKNKTITDVSPGDFDSPAFSPGGGGLSISHDGKEVCFTSNREEPDARAWTTNKDLFVVSSSGGEPVNITRSNKAYDGHPEYSPDGKYIAFVRQEIPGYESDRPRLAVYERDTGKTKILTEEVDWWVIDYKWSPDSRSIIVKGAVEGRFPLFKVMVESGKIQKLSLPSVRSFSTGPKSRLAFTFTRIGRPLELYTMSYRDNKVRRLTGFNDSVVKEFDIRPAEEVRVKGAGDKPVHMFIIKPHGYRGDKKYPLILNIHGGPQYQWSDTLRGDWQVYPGAGYVVAFPNPHGSIGYGQDYTKAISGDWGGKVYDDIMKVTEWLSKQPYVDPEKMGAMGWSYGGYMVNFMLGRTKKFKAMASMMGIFDLESFYYSTEELWFPEYDVPNTPWKKPDVYKKWSPSTYAEKMKTPTLIITGKKDYRVPYTQSIMLFTALKRQGVPSKLIIFPDDGHWPSYVKSMPIYYSAHLDWFQKYLGGQPAKLAVEDLIYGKAFSK